MLLVTVARAARVEFDGWKPLYAASETHRHDDVFVIVVGVGGEAELRLRVAVFELEGDLAFTHDVEEIM